MTSVGIVGGASVDHVVRVPVGAAFDLPGGPGLFAALAARVVLGASGPAGVRGAVRLGGPLPTDAPEIEAALLAADIDTRFAPVVAQAHRLWILDAREGRRVIRTAPPAHELAETDPDDDETMPEPRAGFANGLDALLLCAPDGPPTFDVDAATVVAVDPHQSVVARHGWAHLDSLAKSADLLLPSRVQLRQLAALEPGDLDAYAVAVLVHERTGMDVVARLDAEGSLVLAGHDTPVIVPAAPVDIVDTTGAGDTHAGALVAAWAQGADLVEATRVASRIVTRTLADWGARGLLASATDTESR